MVPLHTGGYLDGMVLAARARERAAVAVAEGMRAEVALRVREAYLRAQYGVEIVAAFRSRLTASSAKVENTKAQLEVGRGIEASVRRVEAEFAEAQKDLTMAENDRKKMVLDLLAEMGASMESLPTLSDPLLFQPPPGELKDYLRKAETARGELFGSRQRFQAAHGLVGSAQGALRPQFYGFAMGDAFSPRDAMGNGAGNTFGIVVSVPVFDGGMRRSEVNGARAMHEQAKAEAERWKLQVEKEVRQTWLDIETSAQNYETAKTAVIAAEAAYEVITLRVQNGKSLLVEQLDALAALVQARTNLAQALFEHELSVARLHRAVGDVQFVADGAKPQ
jgi:outer membrane protein TolC